MIMKFAIMFAEYAESVGFDITHWRKSLDGNKAIAHYDYAAFLCEDSEIDVYDFRDPELLAILASSEWTEQVDTPETT